MTNPLLMSQLHGDANFGARELEDDPEYDTALEMLADEYVKEEVDGFSANSPMLTKEQAKEHLKRAFKKAVRMDEQKNLLNQAVRCIMQDGSSYLSAEDWALLKDEMEKAATKLSNLNYQDEMPEILFPFLGMTQKGVDAIDTISRTKFKEENYALAMALSVLLTTLNPREVSYWFHLGISCQEGGFYEKAIKAYSICHLIDFANVTAWLFCSECYLNNNNKWDAKIELEEAVRIIASMPDGSQWDEQLNYLKKCLAEYKN